MGTVEVAGLSFTPLETFAGTAKLDLALSLVDRDGSRICTLELDTDRFDPATGERLLGHFRTLLVAAVARPEERVSRLPLWTPEARDRVVRGGGEPRPLDARCVHESFRACAARAPGRTALVVDDEALTYGELAARVGAFARRLRAHGVGPGTRVGLCLERSVALVVGMLAVLEAGGAYVPLDPGYPRERLALVLDDARLAVLVTHGALLPGLPEPGVPVVRVDQDEPDRDAPVRPPTVEPEAVSYTHLTLPTN